MKRICAGSVILLTLVCLMTVSVKETYAAEQKKITMEIVEWRITADGQTLKALIPMGLADNTDPMQIIEKLAGEKKAEIISAGQVTTTDNQTVRYTNGQDIWYLQKTKDGAWKLQKDSGQDGTTFDITPIIQNGGKIFCNLECRTSKITDRMNIKTEDTVTAIGMPIISTQEMTQSLLLQNGKTTVLGGMAAQGTGDLTVTIFTVTATIGE